MVKSSGERIGLDSSLILLRALQRMELFMVDTFMTGHRNSEFTSVFGYQWQLGLQYIS